MSAQDGEMEIYSKRVLAIREEMKFEIGILHDRINSLVSAEAFLIISFTMSLAYSNDRWSSRFFWIAPLLASIGLLLAVLAWPGINRSFEIVADWNVLLIETLNEALKEPRFVWRPSGNLPGDTKTQSYHRRGMLFTRLVPAVFAVAWVLLAVLVLTGPMRQK